MKTRTAATVAVLALVMAAAGAQNWPSFRGSNGSGLADRALPSVWDGEKGRDILWKTPLPGGRRQRWPRLLVISEVALALALVITAGRLVKSLLRLSSHWRGEHGRQPSAPGLRLTLHR